ncbi:MAG TPA: tRNA lysidine(34) synthetase TilS [Steroidobacteraceae bacterium]|nr:tRNA lysidine(34) synthetase TilS [Steroidobacteraceae bacterium]
MSPRGKARAAVAPATAPDALPPDAFSSDSLTLELSARLGALSGQRLCVAYSGGLDSSVLLHALASIARRERMQLRAVHVNHHLHGQAEAQAAAAARAARRWRVRCRVLDAPVRARPGESLEAAARTTRYAALAAELASGERLLTAHHQEDQFETVMLALLRGSGVRGLAAMRPASSWQGTLLLRPLLGVSRRALEHYARAHALAFLEDPTNADERFDRNYLRRRVLPLVRERWPSAAATVSRSAALLWEARELLERQALCDLGAARDGSALRVSALRWLPEVRRRNALRQWIGERGLTPPDHRRLREAATRMLSAREDASPSVRWRGGELRRHADRLVLVAAPPMPGSARPQSWDWRLHPWLTLADGARLGLVRDPHGDVLLSALPARLTVGYRRGGERLRAAVGRVALKDLLQAQGLPPWQRATVPLLCDGERLIAIADLWVDPAFRAPNGVAAGAAHAGERARLRWRVPAG